MSDFFDLVASLQASVDDLDSIVSGGDTETVSVNGVSKDTISKAIKDKFTELLTGQRSGVISFTTYALLDAYTPTIEQRTASFKVSNDTNTSLNGFYHWVSGTAYVKDEDLANGVVVSDNLDATSGDTVFTAINNSERSIGIFATNLMNNGIFQEGHSGWNSQRWTSFTVNGVFIGESSGVGSWSYTRRYPPMSIGNHYYYSYHIHTSRALEARVIIQGAEDLQAIDAGIWTRVSGIVVGTSATGQALFGAYGTAAGDIIKMDNIVLLDLTATFGVGVEPSVLEVDTLMKAYQNHYFDGDASLVNSKSIMPLNDINRTNSINITKLIPLASGYYDSGSARLAVPQNLRVGGISVSYQTCLNQWREDRFISNDTANWDMAKYWLSEINNVDLYKQNTGYGVVGSGLYVDLGTEIIESYSGDVYFEFVMKASSNNPTPDLTQLYGVGLTSPSSFKTYLRRRFASRFEFTVYDSNGTRHIAQMDTEVDKPTHMIIFIVGEVLTYCVNGVIIGTMPIVGGMKEYPGQSAWLRTLESTYLFRVGSTTNINPEERFNNGKPLEYVATDAIYETKTDGINPEYLKDNVSKLYLDYIDASATLITENPYPNEVIGSGPPSIIPQFIRQRYFDTLSKVEHIAFGRGTLADWYSLSTSREVDNKQEILVSGANIKTINNVSVLGGGNLTVGDGGVSVETKEAENVTAYGAVGNGIVNDTVAIKAAQAVAKVSGVPVVFPGNKEYLITEGLILENGMELLAFSGAKLKRPVPVTQYLAADMVIGQTFAIVSNGSAYAVGVELAILKLISGGVTHGIINDIVGNTLYFTPRPGYSGAVANHKVAEGAMVTTAFSMVTTNKTVDTVNNIVDGFSFVTQSQPSDPDYYFLAIIHFNAESANATIQNNKIDGSGSDGISLQCRDRMIFRNNELTDINTNAIHFGSTGTEIIIDDNKITRAGRNGVFHCYNNDRVTITNNHFTECKWGVAEMDSQDFLGDRNSIIAHNTFENCELGIGINGGYGITIDTNIFTKMELNARGVEISSSYKGAVNVKGNTFSEFKANYVGDCITVNDAANCNINGNIISEFVGSGIPIHLQDTNGQCDRIMVSGNNIESSGLIGIKASNTLNCMISPNIIKVATGGTPVLLTGTNSGLVDLGSVKVNS